MWATLTDHLQVVYGAAAALAIVVLLTPAVGGVARRLGAVDEPDGRRLNVIPIPRLGGIALFLGIFVPALAFLRLGHQTRGLLIGAALGFLRHNFYPARIFMGDSGALLLGFVLATVSIQGLLKTASVFALFFPLLVLAVPILDTSFVFAKRLKHGRPIYEADRAHLHHRFLNIGFSQRRAAVTMYAWFATLAGAALATRFIPFHAHGRWHVGAVLAAGAIYLLAFASS